MQTDTVGTETYFLNGCLVDSDYIYIAEQLEDIDPREYTHTRMGVFIGRVDPSEQWGYHDVNANIVSVTVKQATPAEPRRLIALSKEGEIEIFSNKDKTSSWEKIPNAGLRLGDLGYMRAIREIGSTLFACGYNDQVYMRQNGTWTSLTLAPLQHRHAASDDYGILNSIDGFSENDLYVVGWKGRIYHWNGNRWQRITVNTDEDLQCVRCYGKQEVWICGANGTLLAGNASQGFQERSQITDNSNFWSLAKFKNKVYLASTDTLFAYDGQAITPVVSGLNPEIETYTLDANNDALWSFGAKDIVTFDGATWTRIDHPDNPPIRP